MGLVDDALTRLGEMADELGLEDDDRESFIESSMTRKGFKKTSAWAEPDAENGGKGGGDFFSRKQEGRRTRPANPSSGGFTRYAGS